MIDEPTRRLDEGVLRALVPRVLGERHRWHAVRAHLHELDSDPPAAAAAYAKAAHQATNVAERDHLVRQAARARAAELCS